MRGSGVALAVALLAGVLLLVEARIQHLQITRDDRRLFHIQSFGYEPNGHFSFILKKFELYVRHPENWRKKQYPNQFRIAFVLQRSTSDAGLRSEEAVQGCFHESDHVNKAEDTVILIPRRDQWPKGEKREITIEKPGYYNLYFSNCEEYTQVSFGLKLEQYNQDANGNRNYLSAGESSLPTWYIVICSVFVLEAVLWFRHMIKHRAEVKSIHYLMTAVLLLKMMSLFFESFEYHYLKSYGTAHGWNVVYYIFSFVKSMLLFVVIVLIGTGWSYLKPFLTERDKQIVLAVLVVQMMTNVAMVVINETSPGAREWLTWRDVLHLLDMVCCCAILLPIVWSIRHLREAAEADGKAARNMLRLKRFRKFYLLVVSYIYFTRIIVFLLESTLAFEYTWLGNVFEELAALVFYFTTGYLFRPRPDNPYLALDDATMGPDSPDDDMQLDEIATN